MSKTITLPQSEGDSESEQYRESNPSNEQRQLILQRFKWRRIPEAVRKYFNEMRFTSYNCCFMLRGTRIRVSGQRQTKL